MSRPEHVTCIRRMHAEHKYDTWCGQRAAGFCFEGVDHAAENGLQGGRLTTCPECADAVRKALTPSAAEPIPPLVYWAPLADNFYDADGKGQGNDFYVKWKPRRAEFPQGESAGWGRGSAHNPFKDAPRTP